MSNNLFSGMQLFCEIVETGSFAAAAKSLDYSASHVSKEMARLEDRLGSRLMNRTTRTFTLTDSGRMFYDHARLIVEDAANAERHVKSLGMRPSGRLRLSAAPLFSQDLIDTWLAQFLALYPEITCSIERQTSEFDFRNSGLDAMLCTAPVLDQSLSTFPLLSSPIITVATPEYLGRFGTPITPENVGEHDLIVVQRPPQPSGFHFAATHGAELTRQGPPRFSSPCDTSALTMAMAGLGLAQLPEILISNAIKRGQLIPILQEFAPPPLTLYLVHSNQNHKTPKLRALIAFLNEKTITR